MSCILKGLIMVYRVVGFTMGNQGSIGCLFSCQLSGLCPDNDATLVVFLCGVMVSVTRALRLVLIQRQGC